MKNLTSTPFTTSRLRINERHRRSRPLSLVRISPQPDFRPAVVLPDNGPDVVVAFISSHIPENLSPADIALARSTPEFLTTGLKTDSVIRLDKITTIIKTMVAGTIGELPPEIRSEVNRKMAKL